MRSSLPEGRKRLDRLFIRPVWARATQETAKRRKQAIAPGRPDTESCNALEKVFKSVMLSIL
jgi:hypothetical protein